LFPIVTQIQPSRIHFFYKGNLPAATPTFEFLLASNRVVHVAKVLNPNEAGQVIAFRKAIQLAESMLVQTPRNVISDPDVQRRAVFIRENVNLVVVVTHRRRSNQRCWKAWPHASHFVAALRST
jgi:hypothetical protein